MNQTKMTNEKWVETLGQMMMDMPKLKMARTCYDYLTIQGIPPTEAQSQKLFEFWNKFKSQAKSKMKEEIEFTKQSMKQFDVETTPDAEWIRDFERRLLTSYVPMLEDLVKYFKLKHQTTPSIKIPNKLKSYFENP